MRKIISFFIPVFYFLILPFVSFPKFYDPYELPKTILLIFFSFFFLSILIEIIISHRKKEIKYQPLKKAILLFFIILVISWLINGASKIGFWGQYFRYQGLITQLSYLISFFIFSNFEKLGIKKSFFGKIIAFAGFANSLFIIIQGVGLFIFRLPIYHYNGRLAGNFGNPNFAAGFLALSYAFYSFYPFPKTPKLLSFFIFLVAILFTQSRSGLIALATVLALSLINNSKNTKGGGNFNLNFTLNPWGGYLILPFQAANLSL